LPQNTDFAIAHSLKYSTETKLEADEKYSAHAWFNGQIGKREEGAPSVASASFHLGTSVFDGLMAYWNRDHYYIHRGDEHLVRFREGAKRMGLALSWSVEEILAGIKQLLDNEPVGTQYVRPIAYWRTPELWITGSDKRSADVSIFTVRTESYRNIDSSITCQISPVERISSGSIPGQTKVSGSYVNSYFARRTAELAGFDDGIMFDREGRLAEASAANVFVIIGDGIVTPPPNPDVFPGITRQVILGLARDHGIDAIEQDLRRQDLQSIDGAFLCSTLMEIRGLSRLGERPLATLEHPVYKTLVKAFRGITDQ
jgi:branched-chain amino acid aminotransferase